MGRVDRGARGRVASSTRGAVQGEHTVQIWIVDPAGNTIELQQETRNRVGTNFPAGSAPGRGQGMDRSAINELQMHGQDIPWLLQHWAAKKPDHPALIWEPVDGAGHELDLRPAPRRRRATSRPDCATGGSSSATRS